MKNIEQIDLGNGEIVSMKKSRFGYRIVHPHKNPDGSINYINLLIGGWENFFKLLFILFVLACFLYGFKQITESCKDMAENPEKYFECEIPIQNNLQLSFKESDYNEKT